MTGYSQYNSRDGRVISIFWALASALIFVIGLLEFVNPDSTWHWSVSGTVWFAGLISAGCWVDWRSR